MLTCLPVGVEFGRDTVKLGYPGSEGPLLDNQVLAATAATDFWLGSFGIDAPPGNLSNFTDPQPSFLETLANRYVTARTVSRCVSLILEPQLLRKGAAIFVKKNEVEWSLQVYDPQSFLGIYSWSKVP